MIDEFKGFQKRIVEFSEAFMKAKPLKDRP
jgi:hypothetical protein